MLENKLQRIAENTKLMRVPAEGKPREAFDTYEQQFAELVELCEDYWYILRIESFLFCSLPQRMFGKPDPALVEPLTKSFILQMIVISVLGYLISNQDYVFQEAHLAYLAYNVHNAFLIFMKCILTRFNSEMF